MSRHRVLPSSLVGTSWVVNEIGGQPLEAGVRSTLVFGDGGKVSGQGGCNSFHSSLEPHQAGSLRMGPIAATRMACPPPQMDQETRYFVALERLHHIEHDTGKRQLYLVSKDHGTVVQLSAEPTP